MTLKDWYYGVWAKAIIGASFEKEEGFKFPKFVFTLIVASGDAFIFSTIYLLIRCLFSLPIHPINFQLLDNRNNGGLLFIANSGLPFFFVLHYYLVFYDNKIEAYLPLHQKENYTRKDAIKAGIPFIIYFAGSGVLSILVGAFQKYIPVLVK